MAENGTHKNQQTVGALFAGIGGFCLGFEKAGAPTTWALDNDPVVKTTYNKNFPNTEFIDRNIVNAKGEELSPVDILHAGFPCQSFSQAGNRRGFEDERGKLFFQITRLIKEWGSKKPKVLVFENSPYLRIGGGGQWFDRIRLDIQRLGYWFTERNCYVLDTFDRTSLPQKRPRLFMIAASRDCFTRNTINLDKPLSVPSKKPMVDFLEPEGEVDERYFLPRDNRYSKMILDHVQPNDKNQLYQLRKYIVRRQQPNECPTLTANMGAGGHNVPFLIDGGAVRKLTERECLKLQGFPSIFRFPKDISHTHLYRMIGNSVSPMVSKLVAKAVTKMLEDV